MSLPARDSSRPQPTLTTARLKRWPLIPSDAERLVLLAGEWDVARMVSTIPHPYTDKHAQEFLAGIAAGDEGIVFAIEQSGILIGCTGFNPQDDGSADLGYWIGKPYWGQGLATEAVGALLRHACAEAWFPFIRAIVFADNPASVHVVEKLGFRLAGEDMQKCAARKEPAPCHVYRLDCGHNTRAPLDPCQQR